MVHHLIDLFDVRRSATVAEFQAMARAGDRRLRGPGVVPIVVGGSALYIRAIVDDFQFPGTDPDVRAGWESELDLLGPEGCTGSWPIAIPRPRPSCCPATAAGWSGRSR